MPSCLFEHFSKHICQTLQRTLNVNTVEEANQLTDDELLKAPGFGKIYLQKLRRLKSGGFCFDSLKKSLNLVMNCTKCDSFLDEFNSSKSRKTQCRACYSEYMRNYFKEDGRKKKRNARTIANRFVSKGIIIKELCKCGNQAELHHPNYNNPTDIYFLCKICHAELHSLENKIMKAA